MLRLATSRWSGRISGILAFLLMCTLITIPSQARQSKLPDKGTALIFQVNSIGTLGNFGGYGLAIKKHTSTSRAWRLGLSFDIEDQDSDQKSVREDTTYTEATSDENWSRVLVSADIQRVWYLKEESDLLPFVGVGPAISWYSHHRKESSPRAGGRRYTDDNDIDRFAAGLSASLGAEWFFTGHMSLHAELKLEAKYQWESVEAVSSRINPDGTDIVQRNKRNTEGFYASTESARLGLSLYF